MANIVQTNFLGDPTLGLFGFASDKYALLGPRIGNIKKVEAALGVKAIGCKIFNTDLAGIFAAGNSSGIAVPSSIEDDEMEELSKNLNVLTLNTKYTAIGNLMLINDNGCLISRLIKEQKDCIEKFFGIECRVLDSKIMVISAAAIATNKGCAVHPIFSEKERKNIEDVLKVETGDATANFGSPYVGACTIANSSGLIVSEQSTGIEVSRLEEVLFGLGK
jgi:translation initiation factor 6